MNFIKLQVTKLIHRNLLHFYTLTTKDEKEKFKTQFHLTSSKRIKYLGINLPKERRDLYSDTDGWKEISYHVHGLEESVSCNWLYYRRQSIDCNPHQVTNGIFHRTVWRHRRHQTAKAILRKKNGIGGIRLWLQTVLQSYSHQNTIVRTQKQKYRSME